MKFAVLGTGVVGRTLAGKLASLGHDVTMGTRDPAATASRSEAGWGVAPFPEWKAANPGVKLATFAEAAAGAEVIVNASTGMASLAILEACEPSLAGKVLIDVSNPLDFSKGMPPTLTVCNTDSLGEQIQRRFPGAKVVKTLNTVTAALMTEPRSLADGDHTMFLCGDDAGAKRTVEALLREGFGWRDVIDTGDIAQARGLEMLLPNWVRLYGALQNPMFNLKIVR